MLSQIYLMLYTTFFFLLQIRIRRFIDIIESSTITYDDCITEGVDPLDSIAALKAAKVDADAAIADLKTLHDERLPEWEEAEAEALQQELNETQIAQVTNTATIIS